MQIDNPHGKNFSTIAVFLLLTLFLFGIFVFVASSTNTVLNTAKYNLYHNMEVKASVSKLYSTFKIIENNASMLKHVAIDSFDLKYINNKESLKNYIRYTDLYCEAIAKNTPEANGVWLQLNPDISFGKSSYVSWVTNRNGKIVKQKASSRKLSPEDDPYYFDAINAKKPVWSNIYLDTDIKVLMVTLSLPLYKNGQLIGVAGIDMNIDNLSAILESIHSKYNNSELFIIDEHSEIIASSSIDSKKLPDKKIIDSWINNLKVKNSINSNFEYEENHIPTTAIVYNLTDNYHLIITIPNSVVFHGFGKLTFITNFIFFLLIILTVSLYISRARTIQTNKKLEYEKSLFSGLLNSIPDLVFYKDINGVYLGCNPAFSDFVGLPKEEIVGKTDYDLFPKDLANFFVDNDKLMMESKQPKSNEEWIDYLDGRKELIETLKAPLYNSANEIIGLLGISRNITMRKILESKVQQAEHEINTILNSVSEVISYIDTEYNIKWTNEKSIGLFNKNIDQIINNKCYSRHDSTIKCQDCPVADALNTGKPYTSEIKDNKGRYFIVSANPVYSGNKITGVVETIVDITDQKKSNLVS